MAAQIVQVIIEIGHKAWYRKKATPERTHDWILFVRGSDGNDLSHFVEKIVFNLHQSFNPPKRLFKSPPYELRESGYGEFMPMIDIYFKNKGEKGAPRKVTIQYYLNLNREDSPPIDNVRPEKLKFHNPADEFLEKVLKAGGVILGPDGCPVVSKPRPLPADLQLNNSQSFDSRNHDISDFLVDVDSAAKSAKQLAKKRKRSTEANPMSNDSNSSNESLTSRRSSKSDRLDKDSDARSVKHKTHISLFESIDDELSKRKKKQSSDSHRSDSNKSRSVVQKPTKVDAAQESKHRSSKDEQHKHSSSKSHHRRDESRRSEHHEKKSSHDRSHSKPKSADRNSRSSSRTPSKLKSSESSSGSRVHGSSSSSHGGGGTSSHHRSLSSSSRHHSSSSSLKGSKVEGSRHGGQSQKTESSSSSSKHRPSSSDVKGSSSQSRKMDVQIRLSPVDIHASDNPRSSASSSRSRLEASSSGNRIGPSPDGFSSDKPNQFSPVKKRVKNPTRGGGASPPTGYLPPTFELNGKSYNDNDPFSSSSSSVIRSRPTYDKLLDDMKSDDEEEDGEIRSPVATEPPESVPSWKASRDRKEEKSKDSLYRKKSSSRSSSSATPRQEKPERFGSDKLSPTKGKSDWSSSLSSEKTSPEDVSFSASSSLQIKAKKSKENVDSDSRLSKKPNALKSGASQKDLTGSHRTTTTAEKVAKQTTKGLPATDTTLPFSGKSEEKENNDFFEVEALWDDSYATSQTNVVSLTYNEKKSSDVLTAKEATTCLDRAPNGELLLSLVELKEKINRVKSAALLNRIIDIIEATGKIKSDDEALEFDFCQLDQKTMRSVKQLLETVSD